MDDGRVDLVEVLESVDDLHDDGAAFLLRHQLILLQVEVQVVAVAVLQHCAEPAGDQRHTVVIHQRDQNNRSHPPGHLRVRVEREVVVEFDYSGMIELFMDSVFPAGVSGKTQEPFMEPFGSYVLITGPDSLVVVLFLLLLPVLVELVDFNGHIPLLC